MSTSGGGEMEVGLILTELTQQSQSKSAKFKCGMLKMGALELQIDFFSDKIYVNWNLCCIFAANNQSPC
jgi:hypothetical protein